MGARIVLARKPLPGPSLVNLARDARRSVTMVQDAERIARMTPEPFSRSAMAQPIPFDPPVNTTDLPAKS